MKKGRELDLLRGSYLYSLHWTAVLASPTLDAVRFSYGIRLLIGGGMAWGLSPLVDAHGADTYADAMPLTDVPVDGHIRAMYPKLLRRINRSPNTVPLMLSHNLSIPLEILIYRQFYPPEISKKTL